jgi:hypothetical protein
VQFPIHIELRRSRLLVFSLLLSHFLASACVIALSWSWLLILPLLVLIGVSAWCALQPSAIIGLRLATGGGLDCLIAGNERVAAVVLADSTVFNQLIVLRMEMGDARRVTNLILLTDSMSSEEFRLLRLWLRWRGESLNDSAGKGA